MQWSISSQEWVTQYKQTNKHVRAIFVIIFALALVFIYCQCVCVFVWGMCVRLQGVIHFRFSLSLCTPSPPPPLSPPSHISSISLPLLACRKQKFVRGRIEYDVYLLNINKDPLPCERVRSLPYYIVVCVFVAMYRCALFIIYRHTIGHIWTAFVTYVSAKLSIYFTLHRIF